MNRKLTNAIRFFMDECLPPVIRDSRWFMYPFYVVAYRNRNVKQAMDFKRLVYQFSREEYRDFYDGLDSISRHRVTDLNELSTRSVIDAIPRRALNVLDVGCGRGYLLNRIAEARPDLQLTGCDVVDKVSYPNIHIVKANIDTLPFADNSFDVVTCSHTLEHIVDLSVAVSELTRVARDKVIIIVPKQRYYYYTLDEHINFFPQKEILEYLIGLKTFSCRNLNGDWFYDGTMNAGETAERTI